VQRNVSVEDGGMVAEVEGEGIAEKVMIDGIGEQVNLGVGRVATEVSFE